MAKWPSTGEFMNCYIFTQMHISQKHYANLRSQTQEIITERVHLYEDPKQTKLISGEKNQKVATFVVGIDCVEKQENFRRW